MPKTTYGSQRKRGRFSVPLMTLAILVLGLIGGALILQAGGVIQIPLLSRENNAPEPPDYRGKTKLPISVRAIPAYTKVSRDDILDPKTKGLAFIAMNDELVTDDMITNQELDQLVGRVLKYPHQPGYAFTVKDFYPAGTHPGPTAGVPPGKRAMRLKASDVPGLHGLNQFDRFDIVMAVAVEVEQEKPRGTPTGGRLDVDGPYGDLAEKTPQPTRPDVRVIRQHAEVKTIVNNGIVVQPVMQCEQIGTSASLLRGTSITSTPVEEIIIAVDPDEVAELNLALKLDAQLQVAMRSGQEGAAESGEEGEIPNIEVVLDQEQTQGADGEQAVTGIKVVEVIRGGEKHLMAVPSGKGKETDTDAPGE